MQEIIRHYSQLGEYCAPAKVLLIYGPRQVGKSTLVERYLSTTPYAYRLDSGDNIVMQSLLGEADFKAIADYVAGYELIVIDEAQRIPNIGHCLKIIVDQHPTLRVIATGSSSFELAGQVGEPLTGRQKTLTLYPVAQLELLSHFNRFELKQQLADYLIYGAYPEVVVAKDKHHKRECAHEIAQAYLLKDILTLDKVKSPKALLDLLRLLAFQLGSEVSHTELAQRLMLDAKTVKRYLDLLEKAFVIYNLRGFSRNLRNEINKKGKYYFFDNGVRNAVIANFNDLNMRDDVGCLWENFLVMERLKKQQYQKIYANNYFWRTWQQKEIDFVEERDGQLFAYEFKWQPQQLKAPKDWLAAYPGSHFKVVHRDNYLDFIT